MGAWISPGKRRKLFFRGLLPAAMELEKYSSIHHVSSIALSHYLTDGGALDLQDSKGQSLCNHFLLLDDLWWAGETYVIVVKETLAGIEYMRRREFRKYPSSIESFLDLGVFLRSQERFKKALDGGAEPYLFFHGLRKAAFLPTGPASVFYQRRSILYIQKVLGEPLGWVDSSRAVAGWDM